MLLSTLSDSHRFDALYPGFARALEFLRQPDLARWPKGRHAVDGDRIVAIVEQRDAVGRDAAVLEVHRRYIDLQYTVAGDEVMATAILDRLLHRSHVLNVTGRSYRLKDLENMLK